MILEGILMHNMASDTYTLDKLHLRQTSGGRTSKSRFKATPKGQKEAADKNLRIILDAGCRALVEEASILSEKEAGNQ